jgi:arsenate reductase
MTQDDLTVYEKRTCSTCRNLVKLLQDRGIDFDRVDYMIDPIPRVKLADLVRKMGLRPIDIVRRKEDAWKSLGASSASLDDDAVLDLLVAHPELVQRPIVERGDRAVLARPIENVESIL